MDEDTAHEQMTEAWNRRQAAHTAAREALDEVRGPADRAHADAYAAADRAYTQAVAPAEETFADATKAADDEYNRTVALIRADFLNTASDKRHEAIRRLEA